MDEKDYKIVEEVVDEHTKGCREMNDNKYIQTKPAIKTLIGSVGIVITVLVIAITFAFNVQSKVTQMQSDISYTQKDASDFKISTTKRLDNIDKKLDIILDQTKR